MTTYSEAYAGVLTQSHRAADKAAMLSMLQNSLMQSLMSDLARTLPKCEGGE